LMHYSNLNKRRDIKDFFLCNSAVAEKQPLVRR